MPFRSDLEQVDAAALIEAFSTFVSTAGLPAYMGWQGASFLHFIYYAAAAGLGLTAGGAMLHPSARPGAAALLVFWIVQTFAVAAFGGVIFQLAGQFR